MKELSLSLFKINTSGQAVQLFQVASVFIWPQNISYVQLN